MGCLSEAAAGCCESGGCLFRVRPLAVRGWKKAGVPSAPLPPARAPSYAARLAAKTQHAAAISLTLVVALVLGVPAAALAAALVAVVVLAARQRQASGRVDAALLKEDALALATRVVEANRALGLRAAAAGLWFRHELRENGRWLAGHMGGAVEYAQAGEEAGDDLEGGDRPPGVGARVREAVERWLQAWLQAAGLTRPEAFPPAAEEEQEEDEVLARARRLVAATRAAPVDVLVDEEERESREDEEAERI